MLPIHRQCERRTKAHAFLLVVVFDVIDRRTPADEVAGIQGQPSARHERVAHARLQRVERRNLARFASEEVVVVRVKSRRGRELKGPRAECF